MQRLVIPGCGRFVAEEAPNEMLAALTAFLARTGTDPPRRTIPGRMLPGNEPVPMRDRQYHL